jgi:pimeloyl-ACP methyl ester carboxylesterase
MRLFGFLTSMVLAAAVSSQALAYENGVVNIATNHKVFYKYQPAEYGQPTIVLLNGLIYSLSNWDKYFDLMADQGYGVLLIAYSAQPESLKKLRVSPYFSETEMTVQGPHQIGLTSQDLVDEVMATVDELGLDHFHVLSLSFSSVVASELAVQHRDRIDSLMLVAPAVMAAHRYNAWGQARHAWYEAIRPTGDYFYDAEIYATMSVLVTPVQYSFEGVNFTDFFDGVFHMGGTASKYFDLKDYANADLPPVHLMLSSKEDEGLLEDQRKFWKKMDGNPAKATYTYFEGGEHALVGTSPVEMAELTSQILSGERVAGFERVKIEESTGGGSSSDSSSSDGWMSFLKK